MKIRDPDAEQDKALAEMGMALPPILATQIAAALKARGREDLAQDVMMLLNPQGAQPRQQPQQPQVPPQLIAAAVEVLASNPETRELAMMIAQSVGVSPPEGTPEIQRPPVGVPPPV